MMDAHCKKHFINYCPDLSQTCPYCRIAELQTEITEIPTLCRTYEKALKEKDKHHDVVIKQLGKRIRELEAAVANLKSIMRGDSGTIKVDI